MIRIGQYLCSISKIDLLEKNLAVECSEIRHSRLTPQVFGEAAYFLPFLLVVRSISKGGEKCNGQDGLLLF